MKTFKTFFKYFYIFFTLYFIYNIKKQQFIFFTESLEFIWYNVSAAARSEIVFLGLGGGEENQLAGMSSKIEGGAVGLSLPRDKINVAVCRPMITTYSGVVIYREVRACFYPLKFLFFVGRESINGYNDEASIF